jgi:hypothetical protein
MHSARFSRFTVSLLLPILLFGCGGGQTSPPAPDARPSAGAGGGGGGIDAAGMDRATTAGDDFFRYANGTWLNTKQIPADRSYDGAAYALYEKTQEQTRQLIEGGAEDRRRARDPHRIGRREGGE